MSSFNTLVFADIVEIRNGVKTTYAEKPNNVLETANKFYSYKWALDKDGNWKLYVRRPNGKLISLSNTWVRIDRQAMVNGNEIEVSDFYYFDYYGNMVTGWYVDVDLNTYYLNTDPKELGKLSRGWTKIGEDYYYFNGNGILQRDTITEDGFYVDIDGKWQ